MVMTDIPEFDISTFFGSNPIQPNPWMDPFHVQPVIYIDGSMESYSQRAVTGASKGTPGNAKCVTEILGDKNKEGGNLPGK